MSKISDLRSPFAAVIIVFFRNEATQSNCGCLYFFVYQELQLSIKNLAERLFPWKPVKLEGNLTMVQLIELVDSFIWEDDENEIARRVPLP